MSDQHLNLFYTYNQDNQLIENNLTRAWVVTLRLLSGPARNAFLKKLLDAPIDQLQHDKVRPSFAHAQFALQKNINLDIIKQLPQRYIITIASHRFDLPEQRSIDYYESKPDAWIYDNDTSLGYCFLVEAKIGANPVDIPQVLSHAKSWLDITDLEKHLISITWYNVLEVIAYLQNSDGFGETQRLNEQENALLGELKEYLGFYGYTLFNGLKFKSLQAPPDFMMSSSDMTNPFDFAALKSPPSSRWMELQ